MSWLEEWYSGVGGVGLMARLTGEGLDNLVRKKNQFNGTLTAMMGPKETSTIYN